MSRYWKYKNLGIFAYETANTIAGPTTDTTQALRDWNRWVKAGEERCPIYIYGQSLAKLRKEPFQYEEELKTFFEQKLFSKFNDTEENKKTLVSLALMHFHQAGFPFATHYCINNASTGDIRASDPISRIDFYNTKDGLVVKEQQTYQELVSVSTGKKNKITDSHQYHAKTITTSLFNTNGITLNHLEIDCLTSAATPIFDKRGLWEKLCQYIINILIDFKYIEEQSEKPRLFPLNTPGESAL